MNDTLVFTQTYGNNREDIFKWKLKDHNLNHFIHSFDGLISFHNSSIDYINHILATYKLPYKQLITFNNISYPKCFKHILEYAKNNNYKKLIFLQDDAFSVNTDIDITNTIIDYIKNNNFDMLNFNYVLNNMNGNETINLNKHIKIFKTTNQDLVKDDPQLWYFDDSPFVANLEFLNNIYDEDYFLKSNIWEAEQYLNDKTKHLNIARNTLNIRMFRNYNFLGMNSWNSKAEIKTLKEKFGE